MSDNGYAIKKMRRVNGHPHFPFDKVAQESLYLCHEE
jgi:hypothetical protein